MITDNSKKIFILGKERHRLRIRNVYVMCCRYGFEDQFFNVVLLREEVIPDVTRDWANDTGRKPKLHTCTIILLRMMVFMSLDLSW